MSDDEVVAQNLNPKLEEDQEEEILLRFFLRHIQILLLKLFFIMGNLILMLYWTGFMIWRSSLNLKEPLIVGR